MAKKPKRKPDDKTIELAKKVLKLIGHRAQKAGVTEAEYVVGIMRGRYPKISDAEAEAHHQAEMWD